MPGISKVGTELQIGSACFFNPCPLSTYALFRYEYGHTFLEDAAVAKPIRYQDQWRTCPFLLVVPCDAVAGRIDGAGSPHADGDEAAGER